MRIPASARPFPVSTTCFTLQRAGCSQTFRAPLLIDPVPVDDKLPVVALTTDQHQSTVARTRLVYVDARGGEGGCRISRI